MAETRFKDIAAHFRQLIDDGTLRPGDKMPPTRKVVTDFNTSSNTVGKAYKLLQNEGLILMRPGADTLVAERSDVAVTGAARLRRMERTGEAYAPGETSTNRWVGIRSCHDSDVAGLLGVELGDEILIRRRVHRSETGPDTIGLSFIHLRVLRDVPEAENDRPFEGRWWQDVYRERTSREVTRSPERRKARLVSGDELTALGIELSPELAAAVLIVVNVFHDEDGPFEVWEDVYPPGAWQVDGE